MPTKNINIVSLSTETTETISCITEKLDKSAETSSVQRSFLVFSDGRRKRGTFWVCDRPLDVLRELSSMPPSPQDDTEEDSANFLRALDELWGLFHGKEEESEPLSEHLATTLDASLRCRPSSEDPKLGCSKIKLPINVPNMSVPATNSAFSNAMGVGRRFLDTQLFHANNLLT